MKKIVLVSTLISLLLIGCEGDSAHSIDSTKLDSLFNRFSSEAISERVDVPSIDWDRATGVGDHRVCLVASQKGSGCMLLKEPTVEREQVAGLDRTTQGDKTSFYVLTTSASNSKISGTSELISAVKSFRSSLDRVGDTAAKREANLAINSDGNLLVIGVPWQSIEGGIRSAPEMVGIYSRSGDNWHLSQQIRNPAGEKNTSFGGGIVISPDGKTLVIAAPYATVDEYDNSRGAIYFYELNRKGNWKYRQSVDINDFAQLNRNKSISTNFFGVYMAFNTDGTELLIGDRENCRKSGEECKNSASGAAFLINRSESGRWIASHIFEPEIPTSNGFYANGLDISGDTVVIGAPGENDGGWLGEGVVYVYTRKYNKWRLKEKFVGSKVGPQAHFGYGLALSKDEKRLFVGSPLGGTKGGGAIYTYARDGSTSALFTEQGVLSPDNGTNSAYFGSAIRLRGDSLIVSAPRSRVCSEITNDPENRSDCTLTIKGEEWWQYHMLGSGAVWVFQKDTKNSLGWAERSYIKTAEKQPRFLEKSGSTDGARPPLSSANVYLCLDERSTALESSPQKNRA